MSDRSPLNPEASSQLHAELRQTLGRHGSDVRVVGDLAGLAIRREARRRRHVASAGIAAVAVLALGVPVGWVALSGTRNAPVPGGPTSSTVAPTSPRPSSPSPTGAPTGSTSPASVTGTLPSATGPAPTLTATGAPDAATLVPASGPVTGTTTAAYVLDGVFHAGDVRITLPTALARPDRATALGSGVLVTALRPQGGPRVSFVDASGAVAWARDSGSTDVVTDGSHTRALFVEPSGRPVVVDASGRRTAVPGAPAATGPGAPPTPVALTDTAAYLVAGDATRTLRYDLTSPGVRSVPGAATAVDRLTERAVVSDPNLSAGQPGYGCQRLVDLRTARAVWTLCGPLSFTSFSADGQHLLGSGFSDGMPPSLVNGSDGRPRYRLFVVARVSDGAVVLQGGGVGAGPYVPQHGAVLSADGTITTQADTGKGTRTLQRCGLDGGCEVVGAAAAPWQPDVPESPGPYLLAEP